MLPTEMQEATRNRMAGRNTASRYPKGTILSAYIKEACTQPRLETASTKPTREVTSHPNSSTEVLSTASPEAKPNTRSACTKAASTHRKPDHPSTKATAQ